MKLEDGGAAIINPSMLAMFDKLAVEVGVPTQDMLLPSGLRVARPSPEGYG